MALPGPYLRGKLLWDRGELAAAARCLDEVAGGDGRRALWLPPEDLERWAGASFESVLAIALATDEHLMIPFGDALAALAAAMPGDVVAHAAEERARATGDAGAAALPVIRELAAQGLLSTDPGDRGLVAKVVVTPDGQPNLAALIAAELPEGASGGAWDAYAREQPDAVAAAVLATAFHRSRRLYPEMAVDALTAIASRQPEALDAAAGALRLHAGTPAAEDVVRFGMRLDAGDAGCVDALAEAMTSRRFEAFASRCLLD